MGLFKMKGSDMWWMSYTAHHRQVRESTGTPHKRIAALEHCVQSRGREVGGPVGHRIRVELPAVVTGARLVGPDGGDAV